MHGGVLAVEPVILDVAGLVLGATAGAVLVGMGVLASRATTSARLARRAGVAGGAISACISARQSLSGSLGKS